MALTHLLKLVKPSTAIRHLPFSNASSRTAMREPAVPVPPMPMLKTLGAIVLAREKPASERVRRTTMRKETILPPPFYQEARLVFSPDAPSPAAATLSIEKRLAGHEICKNWTGRQAAFRFLSSRHLSATRAALLLKAASRLCLIASVSPLFALFVATTWRAHQRQSTRGSESYSKP